MATLKATKATVDILITSQITQTNYITPTFTIRDHIFNGTSVPLIKGTSSGQHIQSSGFVFNTDIQQGDEVSVNLNYNGVTGNATINNPSGDNIIQVQV
jgi:hypothetical protein